MSSPASATKQSYGTYVYTNSNSSGGSTYTGGQGTSNGVMLSQWVTTPDRRENFIVTGQKTGRGTLAGIDRIQEFDRDFYGRR